MPKRICAALAHCSHNFVHQITFQASVRCLSLLFACSQISLIPAAFSNVCFCFYFCFFFVCCCCCSPPSQTRHEYFDGEKNLLKFVAKLCLWPKWQIAKLIVHIFFVRLNAHALHGKLNRDIIVTRGEQLLQFASPPHLLPPPHRG